MRVVLLSLLALLLLAAPAAAQTGTIDAAVQALRSDPVYVSPDADPTLSAAQADDLRAQLRDADAGPVYVAVLPKSARDEAGGTTDSVVQAVHDRLGRAGTYAVIAGSSFSAGSDKLQGVPALADEAVQRNSTVEGVLSDFAGGLRGL